MLCGVPHLKSFCVIGLVAMLLGTAALTWAYPVFLDRVADIKAQKSDLIVSHIYGFSAGPTSGMLRSSSALSGEMLESSAAIGVVDGDVAE